MNPLKDRMKTLVLKISIGDKDAIDKELALEGKAPMLSSVDNPEGEEEPGESPEEEASEVETESDVAGEDEAGLTEANKFAGMIVNGEDRKLKAKVDRKEKPSSFAERMQMEAMKKA